MDTQVLELATPSASLSLTDLFFHADAVVKLVIFILLGASVWCWAIIFNKFFLLNSLRKEANRFEHTFWASDTFDNLYDKIDGKPADPFSMLFCSVMHEWRRIEAQDVNFYDKELHAYITGRMNNIMQVVINREMEKIGKFMTVLATTGSTAPFIGLLGTVWGIMNSFQAIGASRDTSLAVVAPGIAEALFATAIGLVAAIPAVIGYNKFSHDIDSYALRLEMFSEEFLAMISRHIEKRNVS